MFKRKKEDILKIYKRGKRLFRLKQFEEALKDFDKCKDRIEDFDVKDQKDALMHLALSYYNTRQIGKCEEIFQKALEIDKDVSELFTGYEYNELDINVLHNKGLCNLSLIDDINKPIDIIKRELGNTKSKHRWEFNEKRREQLREDIDTKNKEYRSKEYNTKEALDVFKALVKLDKNNSDYWYLFGLSCYLNGYRREAIDAFDAVLDLDPEYSNKEFISDLYWQVTEDRKSGMEKPGKYDEGRKYKTNRGVLVRSKAEVMIDNFYFKNKIKARYEPALVLSGKTLHPDWIIELPDGTELIHEHVSQKSKSLFNFKEKLYQKYKKQYIVSYDDEEKDIETALKEKLSQYIQF